MLHFENQRENLISTFGIAKQVKNSGWIEKCLYCVWNVKTQLMKMLNLCSFAKRRRVQEESKSLPNQTQLDGARLRSGPRRPLGSPHFSVKHVVFVRCIWHLALFSLSWYQCWCVTQLVPKHARFISPEKAPGNRLHILTTTSYCTVCFTKPGFSFHAAWNVATFI